MGNSGKPWYLMVTADFKHYERIRKSIAGKVTNLRWVRQAEAVVATAQGTPPPRAILIAPDVVKGESPQLALPQIAAGMLAAGSALSVPVAWGSEIEDLEKAVLDGEGLITDQEGIGQFWQSHAAVSTAKNPPAVAPAPEAVPPAGPLSAEAQTPAEAAAPCAEAPASSSASPPRFSDAASLPEIPDGKDSFGNEPEEKESQPARKIPPVRVKAVIVTRSLARFRGLARYVPELHLSTSPESFRLRGGAAAFDWVVWDLPGEPAPQSANVLWADEFSSAADVAEKMGLPKIEAAGLAEEGRAFGTPVQDRTPAAAHRPALSEEQVLKAEDPLTGLPRREAAQGISGYTVAIYFDLNGFKAVNDTYGHAVGDRLLAEFAAVLRRSVRERDLALRWGGDEFVVLLLDPVHNGAVSQMVADRVRHNWQMNHLAQTYGVTTAVGIGSGPTVEEAVRAAEQEMYLDKGKKQAASDKRVEVLCEHEITDELLQRLRGRVLVDASFELGIVLGDEGWKSDWRLGLRAKPASLPNGVPFFCLSEDLGETEEEDAERLERFVLYLLSENRKVAVNDPKGLFAAVLKNF